MGQRTWTDEQLRRAVSSQKSWRGVLRALGLKATSGGSIVVARRRAEALGLDTSHFSGPRRWSDQELVDAVSESHTWKVVADRLGLAKDRRTQLRLKGHGVRLGLDTSHLETSEQTRPTVDNLVRPADLSELRNAAPMIVASWFALRSFPVATPTEPQLYDLLVTARSGIKRVQVKTTTSSVNNGRWQVGIGHRPYVLDKTAAKEPYDPDDIDLFAVINGLGELYVIPIEAVAGRTGIYLSAYSAYQVGDVSSLLTS